MRWADMTLAGWGRAITARAQAARPERLTHLSQAVSQSDQVLAVGQARSYGDAALAHDGRVIRMERLDRLCAFDEATGVLEAEAGITLGDILRLFAPRGWMPPVLPGTGMVTLGGAIANDIHGKNHHTAGSFGQFLRSVTLMGPDGATRRITPGDDTDLFRATLGGVGQTGVILRAELELAPCPVEAMTVSERRMTGLEDFIDAFETSDAPFQVGWIDALATGAARGRGIFEAATFAGLGVETSGRRKAPKSIPFDLPAFAVSAPIVRAFNAAYLRRVPPAGRTRTRSLESFFFPLDGLANWNRIYGKRGFHQFQCLLPGEAAETGLGEILDAIAETGIASPLAVIKKTGAGRAGHLSFPMEGYTLAVDLPARPGVLPLLEGLHDITVAHGGRIYLAKDSTAAASHIRDMYPELDAWRAVVAKADPDGRFRSAMTDRLALRGDV